MCRVIASHPYLAPKQVENVYAIQDIAPIDAQLTQAAHGGQSVNPPEIWSFKTNVRSHFAHSRLCVYLERVSEECRVGLLRQRQQQYVMQVPQRQAQCVCVRRERRDLLLVTVCAYTGNAGVSVRKCNYQITINLSNLPEWYSVGLTGYC